MSNNATHKKNVSSKLGPVAAQSTVKPATDARPSRLLSFYPLLLLAAFCTFAFWMLAILNADVLFSAQDHNLFLAEPAFLADKMKYAGGLSMWLGTFLTQFFFYPSLGAAILIALWVIIYLLLVHTFRLRGLWTIAAFLPLFALLVSETCLGYWLYYLKMPGYWFTHTVALLIAILFTIATLRIPTRWRWVALVMGALIAYPLIGAWVWAYVAAILCHTLISDSATQRDQMLTIAATILTALVPVLYYQVYGRMRFEDAWITNFPVFSADQYTNATLSLPFVIAGLSPALCVLAQRLPSWMQAMATRRQAAVHSLLLTATAAVLAFLTFSLNYDNYNYHAELRIYRAIDECDYERVLEECAKAPGEHTRQMVVSKNIALMNLGTIGDKMFAYNNGGALPYVYDSLDVHLVHTIGPQLYYNYGKSNFACRWAIENSVEYGFSVEQLKMLTRTSLIAGEHRAARKYINLLRNTTFHRKWAEEWDKMLRSPKLYHRSTEYQNIKPLRAFSNVLDGDDGLCEMYIINYFSRSISSVPKFQEQTLVYALVQKDIELFWQRFFQYATIHASEPMPIHYQEAAYLYGDLEHKVDISQMPFDEQRIKQRYASFQQATQQMLSRGMSAEQVGEATRSIYGDTFWWFYFFCRNIQSY